MSDEIQSVRGFHDIFGEELVKFRRITLTVREILRLHNFEEIILPVVEYAELFQRSIGEITDIVQKEMFTFQDKKGRWLALRPEGTAGAVRAYIQHRMYADRPYRKLFYEGPMFRYERPQAGRYRQFHQIGAEIFGVGDPEADFEIIEIVYKILKKLNIDVVIEINSLGCLKCRPAYKEDLVKFLNKVEENLCNVCKERKDKNPLRVLDCKVETCREIFKSSPKMLDYLCEECKGHFEKLQNLLNSSEIPYRVNTSLVRGLDYYSRTVFEAVSDDFNTTIIAGGRYDYLVEQLGGSPTPATGFAVGVERTALLLSDVAEYVERYIVIPFGNVKEYAIRVANILRRKGHPVEFSYRKGGLRKQLEYADKMGFRYAVIIGEDEMHEGKVTLKDMRAGVQVTKNIEEL